MLNLSKQQERIDRNKAVKKDMDWLDTWTRSADHSLFRPYSCPNGLNLDNTDIIPPTVTVNQWFQVFEKESRSNHVRGEKSRKQEMFKTWFREIMRVENTEYDHLKAEPPLPVVDEGGKYEPGEWCDMMEFAKWIDAGYVVRETTKYWAEMEAEERTRWKVRSMQVEVMGMINCHVARPTHHLLDVVQSMNMEHEMGLTSASRVLDRAALKRMMEVLSGHFQDGMREMRSLRAHMKRINFAWKWRKMFIGGIELIDLTSDSDSDY